MSIMSTARSSAASGASPAGGRPTLIDLSAIDLTVRDRGKDDIEHWIPHRGQMNLLDYVIWTNEDYGQGVGLWNVKPTEFWVPGHFPGRPMLPGVLQIEAGAQMSVYLHNRRSGGMNTAAFTHIREASFRAPCLPGDDLLLLAKELRYTPRRFVSAVQGIVAGRIVFEAQIEGITLR